MTDMGNKVEAVLFGIITLIVLFNVFVVAIPELNTAGDALNATGVPFGNFFVSNGLIVLLAMIGLVVTAIGIFRLKSK